VQINARQCQSKRICVNRITKKQTVLIAARFNDSKKVINVPMEATNHVDATWKDLMQNKICEFVIR
jgi:hypothetical protein